MGEDDQGLGIFRRGQESGEIPGSDPDRIGKIG